MSYAGNGRPAYLRIADRVRAGIARGDWPAGAQIPSASQLAERFSSTRTTVHSALEVLRREGLVVARHGRGFFVREQPERRYLDFGHGERQAGVPVVDPTLADLEAPSEWRVLNVGAERAPEEIASRLGVEEGARVIVRRFLLVGSAGYPLELLAGYLPYDLAAGTRLADPEPTSTYFVLAEEFGIRLDHFVQDLISRMPTQQEARELELGHGDPVLHLVRTAYDLNSTPVHVLDAVLPGQRHIVRHRVEANSIVTT